MNTSSSSATIRFNKSQNAFAVADIHSDEFYFQNKGKELVKVRLSDDLGSSTLYTASGNLTYDNGKAIDGLYITVDADNGDNVYYVTAEGEREKLLSNVKEIDIQSGFIGYIDEDDNLRVAKLNGTELKDEKKVAGDVAALKLSMDGKYLYYVKGVDTERNIGALYRYTLKSEKSEKLPPRPISGACSASISRISTSARMGGQSITLRTLMRLRTPTPIMARSSALRLEKIRSKSVRTSLYRLRTTE